MYVLDSVCAFRFPPTCVLQNVGRLVLVSTYATATAGVDWSYNELSDAMVSIVP